ncbi:hypothetical protein VPLG_00063 [Vibrio phage eugene 12A10]|uniref:hypothetical protein n=1 Tax=Vibrio phage eugene 12A10 TaxID=573172 RepID=UPI0003515415|nr:hypothetical protein VPLG_00063 [Vibrio phage eugene 12A10]AGN51502.1 hypothetical protein VPLG_00063 [Vibrio phage eugene 12A10]
MDIIIGSFIGTVTTFLIWKSVEHFITKPKYAEFGRMSSLIWKFDWNFCLTDYGCTKVFKDGERTTYTFSGKWMYDLLMKDRPSQEKEYG